MIERDPIRCGKCGTVIITDSRNLMNYVLLDDIKCGCGEVVVYKNETMC